QEAVRSGKGNEIQGRAVALIPAFLCLHVKIYANGILNEMFFLIEPNGGRRQDQNIIPAILWRKYQAKGGDLLSLVGGYHDLFQLGSQIDLFATWRQGNNLLRHRGIEQLMFKGMPPLVNHGDRRAALGRGGAGKQHVVVRPRICRSNEKRQYQEEKSVEEHDGLNG